ncbi:hypothetical protein Daura_45010 [Dactylosporangium aurantiacum]|uniref:Uncharacterized protein n=1 Tax=Dactylosporangium aurantiacum TaxID=35754 RepID=A0A9Q9IBZ4_9ACTN|nr:hypothetical protein [Dactylosporangium aurantiacum]MDG6102057.1 hypothetical protein [Dactylosporangium aurantiacum]UWZ53609.1 hypothetical protein Daura_45010 [Dactylosporangium aurantiacum]
MTIALETASLVAGLAGLLAAVFALVQAAAARKQSRSAQDQVELMRQQLVLAERQLAVQVDSARLSVQQAEAYAGAETAIAWRDQVLAFHDRGLTPGQIRYVMHLEHGGAGYEGWHGRIDDIVRGLRPAGGAASTAAPSCDEMPDTREGCTGPCRATVEDSGVARFRDLDTGSPNQAAGQPA